MLMARELSVASDAGNAISIEERDLDNPSLGQHERIQARATDCSTASFSSVFLQGDSGLGIGGYDLRSTADRIFAFDYDHSGKADHIVAYRPGTGMIRILANRDGVFIPRYAQALFGIGGYDLKSAADQAFAFDFDHSGKLDHIVLYRPGNGTCWILKNSNGFFSPVYRQGESGIGGWDLKSPADRAFAFDYDHSGRQDYLVWYRPGTGLIWILSNSGGEFTSVRNGTRGIGGYDLKSPNDLIFPYDYESSGKFDYIVLYRPGTGAVWILRNIGGIFAAVYLQTDPGKGIGGFDLLSSADRAFAFDGANTGNLDHLAFYRPGSGLFYMLRNNGNQFTAVYQEGVSGRGIGGWDLLSPFDQIFAFDYESKGSANYLFNFRPGKGSVGIFGKR